MSGHESAQGHPVAGYSLHPGRVRRAVPPDLSSYRTERDPGAVVRDAPARSGGSRSLGATQREWPEYNRAVIIATGVGVSAIIIAGAVVEAIVR